MLAQSGWNGPLSRPIRENRTRPEEDELGKSREKSHKSSTLTLSIRSCVARTWIIDRVTDAGCTAPQPHASGRLVPGGHRPVAAAVPAMLRSSRASPKLVPGALGQVSTAATGPRGLDSPRGLDTAASCACVLGWAAVAARGHERPPPPRPDGPRASGRSSRPPTCGPKTRHRRAGLRRARPPPSRAAAAAGCRRTGMRARSPRGLRVQGPPPRAHEGGPPPSALDGAATAHALEPATAGAAAVFDPGRYCMGTGRVS